MDHREGRLRGVGGLDLYYQRWCPAGPPRAVVLVVHGILEHSGRYGNLVAHLVPRGYAVYAVDLRGHGQSAGRRGHLTDWDEIVGDLGAALRLVRSHEVGRPLFLLGHSLGGMIVLNYMLRERPSDLAGVIVSSPALAVGYSPLMQGLARVLSRVAPRLMIPDPPLTAATISRDPAVVAAYQADPLKLPGTTARFGAESLAAIRWTGAHAGEFPDVPLLIIHGAADRLVPPEGSRRFFAAAPIHDKTHHEYPGGYHESFNDTNRARALADVESWLKHHLPPDTV